MTAFDEIMRRGRSRPPEPASVEPDRPIWEEGLDEIHWHYTHEQVCHHMAVALRRLTGLPLGIMWNPMAWQIEPDENGRGGVWELVHIYVVTPDGAIIDVKGERSLETMKRDMAEYDWEACPCEALSDDALESLVNDTRNLRPYDEGDVQTAIEVIRRSELLSEAVARYADAAAVSSRPSA